MTSSSSLFAAPEPQPAPANPPAQKGETHTIPVSVVMAVFNGRAFISAAIRSVSQQRARPVEIIVVDDGSADGSADLAEDLGARVIRQPRLGVCRARNTGIRAASSPWIALLDHDDEWLPDKLERQWTALERYPNAVMVTTDIAKIDAEGRPLLDSFLHEGGRMYDRMQATSREDGIDCFAHPEGDIHKAGWFLLPSAVLARRDVLLDVGMFDERIALNEDVSCFLRVLKRGALLVVDEPLTRWRIHASNMHRQELAILRGRLALTRVAMQEPERYPRGYVDRLTAELPGLQVRIGRAELSAGSPRAARASLAAATHDGAGSRAMALWLATWIVGKNADRAAAVWRRCRGR
jgi:glycosyltransferase involved in cell wall biosynthesis